VGGFTRFEFPTYCMVDGEARIHSSPPHFLRTRNNSYVFKISCNEVLQRTP